MPTYTRPAGVDSAAIIWYDSDAGAIVTENNIVGQTFSPVTLADSSIQTLDLSSGNYFDGGELSQDTTLVFSNVPTNKRWTYTADLGVGNGPRDVNSFDLANQGTITGDNFPGIYYQSSSALLFDSNGRNVFALDHSDNILKIGLGSPFDLSSADSNIAFQSLNIADSAGADTRHIEITPDASRVYAMGNQNDRIYQWTMSTPGDLTTVGSASSFLVSSQLTADIGWCFNNDGSRMWVMGYNSPGIYEYNLSTPWDVTTASYSNNNYNYTTASPSPSGGAVVSQGDIAVSADNSTMYFAIGSATAYRGIHEIYLNNGSLGGATYSNISYGFAQNNYGPRGINIHKPTGRMYISSFTDPLVSYATYVGSGKKHSLRLPTSVKNSTKLSVGGKRKTLEFITTDGGTNIKIISDNDAE